MGYSVAMIWLAAPFVAILLAIALLPLIGPAREWWEKPGHQLLVSLVLGLPVAAWTIVQGHPAEVGHALIEYAQFVILLGGLFLVAGGIALKGDLAGTPKVNTIFMAVGIVLSSVIGTTGASMLLIRPMLTANGHRRHRAHLVVFAIFMMANCGGLLTPLGDPPLFLGLLRGVPFTWTLGLWPQWLFVNALLLITFHQLDSALITPEERARDIVEPLKIVGKAQIAWFVLIVVAVALVPSVDLAAIEAGQASWVDWVPWREMAIGAAGLLSWLTADPRARFDLNHFTFGPILEVGALFIGIFLTMVPVLDLLDEHASALSLNAVTFHLVTGGLSSVLDNAPTYASFFEVARASAGVAGAPLVAGVSQPYLVAISTGAVFWGAMTYIGNGPNFMLRSIAHHQQIRMPSFLAYIGWSVRWLLPVLVAALLVFIADPWWAKAIGGLVAALVLVRAVLIGRRPGWIRLPGSSG